MPHKNDIYAVITAWCVELWTHHRLLLAGMLAAFLASLFQTFLDDKKDTIFRTLIEASMCSLIVTGILPVLRYFQQSEELIIPISIFIGVIGTSIIRQAVLTLIRKKQGDPNQ